ncbi:caspase family protein [Nitrospina gracilis]|uniref:caspase family protein n=1 Tax=Nitrospina gracilis TaxID=35801 RepID=UPI001F2001C3|nr:caspase family protein [Nitrospina gracilis]MCF8721119.1 putative caspase-like protein [Nitrospina gracilis Nb-211]
MKSISIIPALLAGFFTVALALPSLTLAEERGIRIVPIEDAEGTQVGLYKESHALIIGVSDYTAGWPDLPGVTKDVNLVKGALEKQGFNVVVVMNPDHEGMQKAFNDFINRYGHGVDNRLLFYFAGHGHTLKLAYGGDMGYIVPADTPNPNRDRQGFLARAMDMERIEVYAKRIESKHALFLFDSCFSGSIFALSRAVPENISYKTSQPVRQFVTAGSAEETVPDESIFRDQFIAALNGEGDSDGDGYLTGVELGEFLQAKVVNYSQGSQHPQYGRIRNPFLDKGDFVFRLDPKPPEAAPETMSTETELSELEATIARLQSENVRLEKENTRLQEDNPTPAPALTETDHNDTSKNPELIGVTALQRAHNAIQLKRYATALRILKVQAARGETLAQMMLARMYVEAWGTRRNVVEAYKWMLLASYKSPAAKNALEKLEKHMTRKQIRRARLWVKSRVNKLRRDRR